MMNVRRLLPAAAALALLSAPRASAHKPITSKYTFNQDVRPIFLDRCRPCHTDGGVGPMSLMTYHDAFPWAESIKSELMAGHMPPGDAAGLVRHPASLSAHELDTVLTWTTGGTPEGPGLAAAAPDVAHAEWPLGPPDLSLELPEVILAPGELETTRTFVLHAERIGSRSIRVIDLLPGTPAIVRRATIFAQPSSTRPEPTIDDVFTLWLPGTGTAAAPEGTGFPAPHEGALAARVTFKKTWKYENRETRDRSTVGIYFTDEPVRAIERISLTPSAPVTLKEDVQAVAVRVDVGRADAMLSVRASLPDGRSTEIIRLATEPEWPRRFWLSTPLVLPRGSQIEATLEGGEPRGDDRTGVALDVVPGGRAPVR